jgi:hypothetical protein
MGPTCGFDTSSFNDDPEPHTWVGWEAILPRPVIRPDKDVGHVSNVPHVLAARSYFWIRRTCVAPLVNSK